MSHTTNIVLGYILLFAGLLLIALPLYQAYQVISGKSMPPQILRSSAPAQIQKGDPFDVQKQIEDAVAKAFPTELATKTVNMACWTVLLALFIFGGKQLAEIGIKLVKS